MKEYRKIVTFTYKNNQYNLYLDNKGKRFFMKVNIDGSLSYLTGDELIEVSKLFVKNSDIMMATRNEKVNIIPKIMAGAGSVLLTSSLFMYIFNDYKSSKTTHEDNPVRFEETYDDYRKYISSYEDATEEEDYYYNGLFKKLYIYNTDYIDNVLPDKVELDDLRELIQDNDDINDEYKKIISQFCVDVVNKYPSVDLRMMGKNLESLKVTECTRGQMYDYTGSVDCHGFYHKGDNIIYVLEGNDYENDEWARQVIYHELSHVLRNSKFEMDGLSIIIESQDDTFNNDVAEEALNTLFSLSLFNPEETNRAYQAQSNYYAVMAECLDYDFTDYINKPLSDFPRQLNEFNGDEEGTAEIILEMIKIQYDTHYNKNVEIDESEFDPILDYLCDMYFKKYVTDDMSYEDAYAVAEELVGKISMNVIDDYRLDYSRVYENLDKYLSSVNDYSQSGKSL